ncbi:MAG: hypothetical protein KDD66_09050 [Bdellovibrionales bacterium]|nr:hypothetical protein [Bdellovibrionales bacterium]
MDRSNFMQPDSRERIARIASRIVESGLETPAVFFLELHRPLGAVFYNTALLFTPAVAPLFGIDRVKTLQHLFAEPENIDLLLKLIEQYSFSKADKTAKISSKF